jgi:hydroxymethylbilane synthase
MTNGARPLRIGTRGSALAVWQTRHVAEKIAAQPDAPAIELVTITTQGDAQAEIALWKTPGRAFFTAEIDAALAAGDIDLAVHSLKDLATVLPEGQSLACVLEREDPADVLAVRPGIDAQALPRGARIGTSSLRRRAFVAQWRPDCTVEELRGNVPNRLQKLDEGRYDAIILAAAGLRRLGLAARIAYRFDMRRFPPAVAQGAIGVTARLDDEATLRWLTPLDHEATRAAVEAERSLLRTLEGGCQVPLGALARPADGALHLAAAVGSLDGTRFVRAEASAAPQDAVSLGLRVAEMLRERGVDSILAEAQARRAGHAP